MVLGSPDSGRHGTNLSKPSFLILKCPSTHGTTVTEGCALRKPLARQWAHKEQLLSCDTDSAALGQIRHPIFLENHLTAHTVKKANKTPVRRAKHQGLQSLQEPRPGGRAGPHALECVPRERGQAYPASARGLAAESVGSRPWPEAAGV